VPRWPKIQCGRGWLAAEGETPLDISGNAIGGFNVAAVG